MVQPAGPVGKRHVVLTSFNPDNDTERRLEFVFSERLAYLLGDALTSGSFGVIQEFKLSVNGCETQVSHNFYPKPENFVIVCIGAPMLKQAENLIAFCEHCNSEDSEFLFDLLLARVTGSDPTRTEYILEEPARCPNCKEKVYQKTFVAPHALRR